MLSIYYSKASGEIYTLTQSPNKQGYERFGRFAEDMAIIFDIMYVEDNIALMSNSKLFKVVNGQIQIKSDAVEGLNAIE